MVKTASRPARAAASTRDRLLDAARQEFAARGFDGAKVQRIVQRARVNKAMLYYHFPSKAALYLAILREQVRAVGDAVLVLHDGHELKVSRTYRAQLKQRLNAV